MARHADPDDTTFRRSLLRAAGGGVLAMVVTFAITAVLTQVGRDAPGEGPVVSADGLTSGPSPSPVAPAPTEDAPAQPTEPTVAPASEIAGEPVSVQVLYAPGLDDLAGEVAAVLRDLGYDVAAVNETARTTQTTTILATAGREDDAVQLRDADPRFASIDVNDGFSEDVALHILVGPDFET